MVYRAADKKDDRIPVKWSRPVSTKYLFELWAATRKTLIDAGKEYLVEDLNRQFKEVAKSQRESIKLMEKHVRFE